MNEEEMDEQIAKIIRDAMGIIGQHNNFINLISCYYFY